MFTANSTWRELKLWEQPDRVQCEVFCKQLSVCSNECAVFICSVQYLVCSKEYAVCSAVCRVQCLVCIFRFAVSSVYCEVCSVKFLVCSVQLSIFNIQCTMGQTPHHRPAKTVFSTVTSNSNWQWTVELRAGWRGGPLSTVSRICN